jgi:hypothetical protein
MGKLVGHGQKEEAGRWEPPAREGYEELGSGFLFAFGFVLGSRRPTGAVLNMSMETKAPKS